MEALLFILFFFIFKWRRANLRFSACVPLLFSRVGCTLSVTVLDGEGSGVLIFKRRYYEAIRPIVRR